MKSQLDIYKVIKDAGKPLTVKEISKLLGRRPTGLYVSLKKAVKWNLLTVKKERRNVPQKFSKFNYNRHTDKDIPHSRIIRVYDLGMEIEV